MTRTDIIERIVKEEVLVLANQLAETLQAVDPEWFEDTTGFYFEACPSCSERVDANEDEACPSCDVELSGDNEPESSGAEAMQWWLVTDWLAEKLVSIGAPVWKVNGVTFWGRTEYGSALTHDNDLVRIAAKLGAHS